MPEAIETVAQALLQARREQRTIDPAPFGGLLQTPGDAYAVQERVAELAQWFDGPVPRHWKSGGPSRATPLTHAPLPPRNVWNSPADARAVHFHVRWLEAEVALRIGREVSPADAQAFNPAAAHQWVDAMTVSIEVVDSRWERFREAAPLLKLADQQVHGGLVLGAWKPFAARDWAGQTCAVHVNDAAPQVFRGTHSLEDPLWLLPAWLRHATRHGATVPRGTVVTTGTWCGFVEARAGDRVRAVFEGIGEAAIQL